MVDSQVFTQPCYNALRLNIRRFDSNMRPPLFWPSLVLAVITASASAQNNSSLQSSAVRDPGLPQVDLGYAVYSPTTFNASLFLLCQLLCFVILTT